MPLPNSILRVIGALSAILALSALAMCVASTLVAPHAVWIMFGFELLMILAGVIGFQFARGAFQEGQGLTLVCVAAVTLLGGFFSYLATRGPGGIVFQRGAGPVSMVPWFAFRGALGGLFVLLAAYAVLRRATAARAYFRRGLVASVLLLAVAAILYLTRGSVGGLPDAVRGVIWAVCGVLMLGSIAAAGHFFIRAFECGRLDEDLATREASATHP